MRKGILFIFSIIVFALNAQTKSEINKAETDLINYLKKSLILHSDNELQPLEYITGDLDNDGINDIVFMYRTNVINGSMKTGSGIVTYIKKSGKYIFSNDYQFTDNYGLDRIENNLLHVVEYFYKPDDAQCCPSIQKTRKFTIKNNQLIKVK